MKRWVAAIFSIMIAGAAFLEARTHPTPADADPFHAIVRATIEAIPMQIGAWSGTDIALPGAAQALLQPNAVVGRRYHDLATGDAASLLVIQCRDTRDMSGHYPPACYPGQGWIEGRPVTRETVDVGGVSIPLAVYHFEKAHFERRSGLVIYDFFILPERGLAADMESVRSTAADHRRRHLGAAQVQVLFDSTTDPARQREVLARFLEPVVPVIRAMGAQGAGR